VCVGSETLIDRNGALRRLKQKGCCEEQNDHALKLAGGQCLPGIS
jgi:hypothetical protein